MSYPLTIVTYINDVFKLCHLLPVFI